MKVVDHVRQMAAFVSAGCRIGCAIDHEDRNIYLLPLLSQADVANLLHVGVGHTAIAADHPGAPWIELDYLIRRFMLNKKMMCANFVGTNGSVNFVGRLTDQSQLAAYVLYLVFQPAPSNRFCRDEAVYRLLRKN